VGSRSMGLATRPAHPVSEAKLLMTWTYVRDGAATLFGTLLARTRGPSIREKDMGSPHRQSGFSNFTLERPAAFVRRAQIVIMQRTATWVTWM